METNIISVVCSNHSSLHLASLAELSQLNSKRKSGIIKDNFAKLLHSHLLTYNYRIAGKINIQSCIEIYCRVGQ